MARSCNDSFNDILDNLLTEILVEKPCKILKIHSPYLVDVEYTDKNEKDILYKVPVRHMQTQKAYLYLALKEGDFGTVRFFDNDIFAYYKDVNSVENHANRKHNLNDNLFVIGFYPEPKQYIFPEGDFVLGTTSGGIIRICENNINIEGGEIVISGGNVVLSGNTKIDGKVFLNHKHSNGNGGNPTGAVI